MLVGQDRVGKTSVGRSLKGETFKADESSTEGVQMDIALKNVDEKPWKNSTEEQEMTAFEEKCARYISDDLLTESPESEALPGLEEKVTAQVDGKSCLGMFSVTFLFCLFFFSRMFLHKCHYPLFHL